MPSPEVCISYEYDIIVQYLNRLHSTGMHTGRNINIFITCHHIILLTIWYVRTGTRYVHSNTCTECDKFTNKKKTQDIYYFLIYVDMISNFLAARGGLRVLLCPGTSWVTVDDDSMILNTCTCARSNNWMRIHPMMKKMTKLVCSMNTVRDLEVFIP